MKKYLLLLLLFLCSCNKEEIPYWELSSDSIELGWEQGCGEIIVNANIKWSIISELPYWLSVSACKKENGATSLLFAAKENDSGEARYCDVVFNASGWNANLYVVQKAKEKLYFAEEKEYVIDDVGATLVIPIERNVDYELLLSSGAESWITPNENGTTIGGSDFKRGINKVGKENLSVSIATNYHKEERHAEIVICNASFGLSDTVRIVQNAGKDYHYDGEIVPLQQSTCGDVNLVLMGDGFTIEDLYVGGNYETIMQKAADYFFSIEPYKSYRDYFNVYAVVAESEEAGVGEKNSWNKVKNKFGTAFGSGTEIVCNDELVLEYAQKIEELPSDKPLTVIVVLNSSKYAGTTYLYANGNSIALCPMSEEPSPNDFEGLIHHEAGGHGFGFLSDEYVYYQTAMPESRKQEIKEWQEYGFQMNLDFTDDPSAILWKDFIGVEKYEQVGAYEGGYEYQYGVWRSEENSCMNNNVSYFNAQSRWVIVNRIMNLSGMEFTVQDFMEADNPVLPDAATRSAAEKAFRPLGNPVWIKTE